MPTPVSVPVTNSPRRRTVCAGSPERLRERLDEELEVALLVGRRESVIRSRAEPTGTVGGRMAGTKIPRRASPAETASARASDPSTNGRMGLPG